MASLLIWGCGFASCEKKQVGRWRSGRRYQEGPGRSFLFLLIDLGLSEILSENLPYAPDHGFYSAVDYSRVVGPGTRAINVNYGWQNDVGTSVTDSGNFVVD